MGREWHSQDCCSISTVVRFKRENKGHVYLHVKGTRLEMQLSKASVVPLISQQEY